MKYMPKDKINKFIFLLLITISSAFITGCSEKESEICNLKFAWWGGSARNEYTMIPIMEDKRVIKVFSDNVFDYVEGRKTCAEAARSFYSAVK